MSTIKYFKIKTSSGFEYIATREYWTQLKKVLGDPMNPKSIANIFEMKLDTLERVTEEEARRAPYFGRFSEDYSLYGDRIFLLGIPNVEKSPEELLLTLRT